MVAITDFVDVSVSVSPAGLSNFNVNNVCLFTGDAPVSNAFDTSSFNIYTSPAAVAVDFGITSETYKQANALFSQNPTILAGSGRLLIAPFIAVTAGEINSIEIDEVGAGYAVNDVLSLVSGAGLIKTASIAVGGTGYSAGDILTITGGTATVEVTSVDAGVVTGIKLLTVGSGYSAGTKATTVSPNVGINCTITITVITVVGAGATAKVTAVDDNGAILAVELINPGANYVVQADVPTTVSPGGGVGAIIDVIDVYGAVETLLEAVVRVSALTYFTGVISTSYPSGAGRKTLADSIQGYGNKILFLASEASADIAGVFTDIKNASDSATRCIYYGEDDAEAARLCAAAYCGRAMSTDFTGSNTMGTMNLKDLVGIIADTTVGETLFASCAAAGVDCVVEVGGLSKVVSNGANRFFDEVYGQIWIVGALQVAGFNALATVSTKVPQTEPGMSQLKSAYRAVCEQAIINGLIAPGSWTSAEFFGNQADFLNNISQRGYYIYSEPITLQNSADREDRKAPLVQIGLKLAGAIHTSIVNIWQNA